jgi:hypothetical protein
MNSIISQWLQIKCYSHKNHRKKIIWRNLNIFHLEEVLIQWNNHSVEILNFRLTMIDLWDQTNFKLTRDQEQANFNSEVMDKAWDQADLTSMKQEVLKDSQSMIALVHLNFRSTKDQWGKVDSK